MNITVDINGKPTEITLTPEQVAQIEANNKPKEFELAYNVNNTYYLDSSGIRTRYSGPIATAKEHGRYRKTQEGAELSLARNKRANRLEALVEYLDGLVEFRKDESNHSVFFDMHDKKWYRTSSNNVLEPETVYMAEGCADRVCELLNNGQYSLEI